MFTAERLSEQTQLLPMYQSTDALCSSSECLKSLLELMTVVAVSQFVAGMQ